MSGIHMGLLASRPPGPAFVASAAAAAVIGGNVVNITKPAGVVAGMLLISVVYTVAAAGAQTWTGDVGWTEQIDQTALPNLRIATLVAGGAEPASYNFTVSGAPTTIPPSMILAFERATFDSIGAIGTSAGVANCIAPSINYTLPGLLLAIFCKDSPGTFSTPAGMTALASTSAMAVFSQFSNIGATGTRTSTPTGTDDNAGVLLGMI